MRLSLTDFVDIAANLLSRKAAKLRGIKARSLEPYSPAKDFYKKLRDGIVNLHRNDGLIQELESLPFSVKDLKRRKRYVLLIPVYAKWVGARKFKWMPPPASTYCYRGADIAINPELGLRHKKLTYVIKLYFKKDPLQRSSADVITGLMAIALPRDPNVVFAVLDVERGIFFLEKKNATPLVAMMIDAELSYIVDMWGKLDKAA